MSQKMITEETKDWFRFRKTPEVDTLLRGMRVFLKSGANDWSASRRYRVQPYVTLHAGNQFPRIGSFSYSHSPSLPREMTIGRYCSIAAGVTVLGPAHPTEWAMTSYMTFTNHDMVMAAREDADVDVASPLHFDSDGKMPAIGNDVWIGNDVRLKRDITIGDGAVIGACSLVTKDVPPYAIVGGVPAKLIRYRFDPRMIERFRALRPWDYFEPHFKDFGYNDPERFLGTFENEVAAGRIKPWRTDSPTLYDLIAI